MNYNQTKHFKIISKGNFIVLTVAGGGQVIPSYDMSTPLPGDSLSRGERCYREYEKLTLHIHLFYLNGWGGWRCCVDIFCPRGYP